ncbi:periplasmic nitrate reductase, NapE protein [Pseudomonas sp.]|jgi:periplasmic nitrate reductase NapE|uniref:periplasmic nitrate reductase, NapE protein n=1 Tax=Pseudomonas sp. TaxID=306 RepID=UPI00272C1EB2|nr:periplasmic nitrate reductase, NapE protein [Pseudomonas sp.]
MEEAEKTDSGTRKRDEALVFTFLIVFLFPIVAVAVVGGFGFMVWMLHHFTGPPGPPG